MLEHWLLENPKDPIKDLEKVYQMDSATRSKVMNGIHLKANIPLPWNPVQAALCWCNREMGKKVIENLVIHGADMNATSLCGLNALHVMVIRIFFCRDRANDIQMLEWWMSKGVDVRVMSTLFDVQHKKYLVLTPLDTLLLLWLQKLVVQPDRYLPMSAYHGKDKLQKPTKKQFIRLLLLFLCYGCQTEFEFKNFLIGIDLFQFDFFKDYLITRLKLPCSQHYKKEVQKRVNFLWTFRKYIDFSLITQKREEEQCQTDGIFYTQNMENPSEFMLCEYVIYPENNTKKKIFFHKSMVPNILKIGHNPFTREIIDVSILQKWFRELSLPPLSFHQSFTLQESLQSAWLWNEAFLSNAQSMKKKNGFMIISSILSHNFPYTNIIQLCTLPSNQLRYVCFILSSEPFSLLHFKDCPREDADSFFLQQCFDCIFDPQFMYESLHFAIEDSLQDLKCYTIIQTFLARSDMTFMDPFMEVILSVPEVGDVIRDRIGYVHLGYFYEIWTRLLVLHTNFL